MHQGQCQQLQDNHFVTRSNSHDMSKTRLCTSKIHRVPRTHPSLSLFTLILNASRVSPSMFQSITFVALSFILSALAQSPTYSATYLPSNAPYQSEQGQAGYNNCTSGYNQSSQCQNAYGTCNQWSMFILALTCHLVSQHGPGLVCLGASRTRP